MIRRAVIIGCPGENPNDEGYLQGVNIDIKNYRSFLTSALGGAWKDDEIVTLVNPDLSDVRSQIGKLKDADYSFTVFCGHGYHHVNRNSTVVILKENVELDSNDLRIGAPKRSVILDCCRHPSPTVALEALAKAMKAEAPNLTPSECRTYFDLEVDKCQNGLVVLNSCSVGESAGDNSERGGIYSSSLIEVANLWHTNSNIDTSKQYLALSIASTHRRACEYVKKRSGGDQTPVIEKPRHQRFFPFAVVA